MTDVWTIVVQYKVDDLFGTEAQLDLRWQMEDWLDEELKLSDNGNCDGGQFGMGTMEIFLYVHDINAGLATVKQVLTDYEYIQWCKIAFHPPGDYKLEVWWPKGASELKFL